MDYTTYRNMPGLILRRCEFKGNSVSAYNDKVLGYVIKSYDTIIYSQRDGLNLDYYSVTTSKIQNIIARTIYNSNICDLRKETKPKIYFRKVNIEKLLN